MKQKLQNFLNSGDHILFKEIGDHKTFYNKKREEHRLDGPACEYTEGSKKWYVNGKRHRLDGPAIERNDGFKFWFVNGKCHKLDGPALEYAIIGRKVWYINDIEVNKEDYPKAVKEYLLKYR